MKGKGTRSKSASHGGSAMPSGSAIGVDDERREEELVRAVVDQAPLDLAAAQALRPRA